MRLERTSPISLVFRSATVVLAVLLSYAPGAVLAGDLDGDGDLDIAVADRGSDSVSVLENDGSGGFPDPGRFPVGGATEAVAVADLDGDGKADIACAKGAADEVAPGNPPRNPGKTRCQSNLWLPPSR